MSTPGPASGRHPLQARRRTGASGSRRSRRPARRELQRMLPARSHRDLLLRGRDQRRTNGRAPFEDPLPTLDVPRRLLSCVCRFRSSSAPHFPHPSFKASAASEMMGRMAGLVQREESVLVVVDAQPGFLAKETFTDADTAAARSALARMAWLVAVAARLELPVVVTEEEPERQGATEAQLAAVLPDGAPVFRKPTFGLANTPEILAAVCDTGRHTAVLIGCETAVC